MKISRARKVSAMKLIYNSKSTLVTGKELKAGRDKRDDRGRYGGDKGIIKRLELIERYLKDTQETSKSLLDPIKLDKKIILLEETRNGVYLEIEQLSSAPDTHKEAIAAYRKDLQDLDRLILNLKQSFPVENLKASMSRGCKLKLV